MTTSLLAITALLVATSAVLYVGSFRRQNPMTALVAMTVLLAAAIPTVVYAIVADT
jgi:ABC-type phosphate transport system permease subunit